MATSFTQSEPGVVAAPYVAEGGVCADRRGPLGDKMRAKNMMPITTHWQDRRHLTWRIGRPLSFVVTMVRIRDEFRALMGTLRMRAHPKRRVRLRTPGSGRWGGAVGVRYPDNTWMVTPQPAGLNELGDELHWRMYRCRSTA